MASTDFPQSRFAVAVAPACIWCDNVAMNTRAQQLLRTALTLPDADRAEMAASLIQSLDPQMEEDVQAAWSAEIKRRLESIDNGSVELIPWDDVMGEMPSSANG